MDGTVLPCAVFSELQSPLPDAVPFLCATDGTASCLPSNAHRITDSSSSSSPLALPRSPLFPDRSIVALTYSGTSVALLDAADVKRLDVWACHPTTVFACPAVVHRAAVYAVPERNVDLPRHAAARTIWSWPCAASNSTAGSSDPAATAAPIITPRRREVTVRDRIYKILAPSEFISHIILVHVNGHVTLMPVALDTTPDAIDLAPGVNGTPIFSTVFRRDGDLHLLLLLHDIAAAQLVMIVASIDVANTSLSAYSVTRFSEFAQESENDLVSAPRAEAKCSVSAACSNDGRRIAILRPLCRSNTAAGVIDVWSLRDVTTPPEFRAEARIVPGASDQPLAVVVLPNHIAIVVLGYMSNSLSVALYETHYGVCLSTVTVSASLSESTAKMLRCASSSISATAVPGGLLVAYKSPSEAIRGKSDTGKKSKAYTAAATLMRVDLESAPKATLLSLLQSASKRREAESLLPTTSTAESIAANSPATLCAIDFPSLSAIGVAVRSNRFKETAIISELESLEFPHSWEQRFLELFAENNDGASNDFTLRIPDPSLGTQEYLVRCALGLHNAKYDQGGNLLQALCAYEVALYRGWVRDHMVPNGGALMHILNIANNANISKSRDNSQPDESEQKFKFYKRLLQMTLVHVPDISPANLVQAVITLGIRRSAGDSPNVGMVNGASTGNNGSSFAADMMKHVVKYEHSEILVLPHLQRALRGHETPNGFIPAYKVINRVLDALCSQLKSAVNAESAIAAARWCAHILDVYALVNTPPGSIVSVARRIQRATLTWSKAFSRCNEVAATLDFVLAGAVRRQRQIVSELSAVSKSSETYRSMSGAQRKVRATSVILAKQSYVVEVFSL